MRLYSTHSRSSRSCPTAPGPIGMYVCGPTVYQRIHVGNARPFVISMWLRSWLRERGYEVTLVENITDINDKIYDAAPGASAQLAEDASRWYIEDTEDLGLGRPDHEPKATETIPEIVGLIQELVERELAYEADGDVYYRVARFPDYGQLSGQRPDQVEEQEPNPAQRGSARLRALEGDQGGRGHLVGLAVGARTAGLAHRVLGDGGEAPRARSSRSTVGGSTWFSRTTRTRSHSRAAPAASSLVSGCTTGCSSSRAKRCRSRSGTSCLCARRSTSGAARRC